MKETMLQQCEYCNTYQADTHRVEVKLSPYHAKRSGSPTQTVRICVDTEACEARQARNEADEEKERLS